MKLPRIELWRFFATTAIIAFGFMLLTGLRYTESDVLAPLLLLTSFSLFGAGMGLLVRHPFVGLVLGGFFPPGLFGVVCALDYLGLIKIYGS